MSTNLLSKKVVVIVAIIAAGAVSAILVASSIAQATAQQQQQQQKMMWWSGEAMPKINGSINVANQTSNFISENVKVPFVTAAQTAQGQVADGKVLGGHLGVVQGYLVYTFFVVNTGNQTGHFVIVDAGNGGVLYTSGGQSLGSFGHSFGNRGGLGSGGPWKGHGFGWGFWH